MSSLLNYHLAVLAIAPIMEASNMHVHRKGGISAVYENFTMVRRRSTMYRFLFLALADTVFFFYRLFQRMGAITLIHLRSPSTKTKTSVALRKTKIKDSCQTTA